MKTKQVKNQAKPIATLVPVQVERSAKGHYRMAEGFKVINPEGRELQPHMPKREARRFCKDQGWDVKITERG